MARQSGVLPKPLADRPVLSVFSQTIYEAFYILTGSRHNGLSVGRIPLSEIKAYLDLVGFTRVEDRLQMVRIIDRLDSFYLSQIDKKK